MHFSVLESILLLLAIAVVVTALFHRLHLPSILGYLLIGVLVGPYGLGWIPDLKAIRDVAEFGVVFLMFTIGLEFSLTKIVALKHSVFVFGGLQVILSALITTVVGLLIGMTLPQSVVVGGIVAMSSTAIVVKQLTDQHELHSHHGSHAVGILLFQDLAVVPFFILVTSFANGGQAIGWILLWAVVKGVFAILVILALGRWLMRPLFRVISKAHSLELFTLTVLLVTLGAAWISDNLGLSLALGAFLAGIMLGETEYRQRIEAEIRPFRDVLMGLFFISIGMLLNLRAWHETWVWILLLLTALVIGKACLVIVLSRLFGNDNTVSLRTALVLAQGGEFGFAILSLALVNQLLLPDYGQVVLGALLLSMGIAPLLIHFNGPIAKRLFRPSASNKNIE